MILLPVPRQKITLTSQNVNKVNRVTNAVNTYQD